MEVYNNVEWLKSNQHRLRLRPDADDLSTFLKQFKSFIKMCLKEADNPGTRGKAVLVQLYNNKLYVTDTYKMMLHTLKLVDVTKEVTLSAVWEAEDVLKAIEKANDIGVTENMEFIALSGTEIRVVKPWDILPVDIEYVLDNYLAKNGATVFIQEFVETYKWKAICAVKDMMKNKSWLIANGNKLNIHTNIEGDSIDITLGEFDSQKQEFLCKSTFNRLWLKDILKTLNRRITLKTQGSHNAIIINNELWTCLMMPWCTEED